MNEIELIQQAREELAWRDIALYLMMKAVKIVRVNKEFIACTDGTRVFIGNKFFETEYLKRKTAVIAHELMHILLQHVERGEGKNRMIWNIATDSVINYRLGKAYGFDIPILVAVDEKESAEEVYERLKKENKTCTLSFDIDLVDRDEGDKMESEGTVIQKGTGEFENDDKRAMKIAEIVSVARQAGSGLGGLIQEIEQLLKPKLNWKSILKTVVLNEIRKNVITTYAKLNRRNGDLPATKNVNKAKVWVLIDVSGSVWHEIVEFVSELSGIIKNASEVELIYWDDGIQEWQKIKRMEQVNLKVRGGGGTVISAVLNEVMKKMKRNDMMIVFTDGYWFDEKRAVEILKTMKMKKILVTTDREVEGFDIKIKINKQ